MSASVFLKEIENREWASPIQAPVSSLYCVCEIDPIRCFARASLLRIYSLFKIFLQHRFLSREKRVAKMLQTKNQNSLKYY